MTKIIRMQDIPGVKSVDDLFPAVPKITEVGDYTPYHCCLSLVQKRLAWISAPDGTLEHPDELMKALGYGDEETFIQDINQWADLNGQIPLAFLGMIGISVNDLHQSFELDMRAYREALPLCDGTSPKYFQYRVMACVYPTIKLPEDISLEGAMAVIRAFLRQPNCMAKPRNGCITYKDLKSIFVYDTYLETQYYEPEMTVENANVIFKRHRMSGTADFRLPR